MQAYSAHVPRTLNLNNDDAELSDNQHEVSSTEETPETRAEHASTEGKQQYS